MSAELTREVRVGRVVVRREATEGGAYRERADKLEIACADDAPPLQRALPMFLLIMVLAGLLLTFAIEAGSWPAIGAVSGTLFALTCLIVFSRRRAWQTTLRIADQRFVAAIAKGSTVSGELAEVDGVGVGVDHGTRRTVWIKANGQRKLLFEGIDDREANAIADVLRDAVDAAHAAARARRAARQPITAL